MFHSGRILRTGLRSGVFETLLHTQSWADYIIGTHDSIVFGSDRPVIGIGALLLARLVVVSNRVAVPSRDGGSRAGGLAVAIRPVLGRHPGIWFGWSGRVAAASDATVRTIQHGHQSYVLADLAEEDYQEYYNGYANSVLWPILHYRLDLAEFSRRDLSGYMRVNQRFAAELDKILLPDDIVLAT